MPNFEKTDIKPIQEAERAISAAESQAIGAKVLASAKLERHPVVNKSFEHAIKHGEKLPGKPAERRALAHLRLIDRAIEQRGSKTEQYLWEHAKDHIHLVELDDITDATWRSIQQDTRDHGGGIIDLTYENKHAILSDYRNVQKQDLQRYVDFFSSEDCPYPTWFKIYAWDGLTGLSRVTEKDKNGNSVFRKRDEHTTAGFPKLNPAALSITYEAIAHHYGLPTDAKEASVSTPETDKLVTNLIQSGSFARLYSYELSTLKKPVEVPDAPEDVRGEWIEYGTDDAEKISDAAEGTPWCIVSPSVADNYLRYGTYGKEGEKIYSGESKAKFYLFHLTDPDTGLPSDQACASIRLDPDGNVAEISGILGDSKQALHDSLVEIVRNKTLQLPGGEKKFQAFQDNLELIRLDRKFQAGEAFTTDELRFIYEKDQEIEYLNPLNYDDRVEEMRNIGKLLKNGTNPDQLLETVDTADRADIKDFIDAGVSIDKLVDVMTGADIHYYLDDLLARKADLSTIITLFPQTYLARDLDKLIAAASKSNSGEINDIVFMMEPSAVAQNVDKLLAAGADADEIAARLGTKELAQNLGKLLEANAYCVDAEALFEKADKYVVGKNVRQFLDAGIDANAITRKIEALDIITNVSTLIAAGVDKNLLAEKLKDSYIPHSVLEQLIAAGVPLEQ